MAKREERGVTIPWLGEAGERGEALEGLFVASDPDAADPGGAVIAPPHPLYGGSMDSPVVSELAWAFNRSGRASLRFNWRGVGASAGQPTGAPEHGTEDFAAALLHLGRSVAGPLFAAGYSFGAATALRAAAGQPRVRGLVLVAPPPPLLDVDLLRAAGSPLLILVGAHDDLAPAPALEALVSELPNARLARIREADHFFAAGLAELGREVTSWLAERR
jgi:alpha/beta superfamily hydrolase